MFFVQIASSCGLLKQSVLLRPNGCWMETVSCFDAIFRFQKNPYPLYVPSPRFVTCNGALAASMNPFSECVCLSEEPTLVTSIPSPEPFPTTINDDLFWREETGVPPTRSWIRDAPRQPLQGQTLWVQAKEQALQDGFCASTLVGPMLLASAFPFPATTEEGLDIRAEWLERK